VAILTVDRPAVRNAIGLATMDALDQVLDAAADADVLVIRGGGDRAFIYGGDLKELAKIRTESEAVAMALRIGLVERVYPRAEFEESWRELARRIASSPGRPIKSVIAAAAPHHHAAQEESAARTFAALWTADAHWTAVAGGQPS